jgi:hypothetical protein
MHVMSEKQPINWLYYTFDPRRYLHYFEPSKESGLYYTIAAHLSNGELQLIFSGLPTPRTLGDPQPNQPKF